MMAELIRNFLFKFCHDNVCQQWTKRATHANTIGLFIQLVVARKDSSRTRVADEFAKRRFLELRFHKVVVFSIYNDFPCIGKEHTLERFRIKRDEFITFGE